MFVSWKKMLFCRSCGNIFLAICFDVWLSIGFEQYVQQALPGWHRGIIILTAVTLSASWVRFTGTWHIWNPCCMDLEYDAQNFRRAPSEPLHASNKCINHMSYYKHYFHLEALLVQWHQLEPPGPSYEFVLWNIIVAYVPSWVWCLRACHKA